MDPDFYADRRRLAEYFEKEWFDHVLAKGCLPPSLFEFPPFDPARLYCESHEKAAEFLSGTLRSVGVAPTRLLEVGSALGRGFYELCRRTPSVRSATLVEPSQNFARTFDSLFRSHESRLYPVLWGNTGLVDVTFDSTHLRDTCRHVVISVINAPHDQLGDDLGLFDPVLCFNVLDQCHAPLSLVDRLKRHTAPGGVLALSCTYQWNKIH